MRIVKSDDGQSTVLMAVFVSLLMLGFLAFAIDTGYIFHEKRLAQGAADAAAVAAAEEDGYPFSSGNAQSAANAAAKMNGFDTTLAVNPATVALSTVSSGNHSSTSSTVPTAWVQAVVSRRVPTFFLGAFYPGMRNMTISAEAVAAEGENTSTCICLTGATGQNLNLSNNAHVSAPSCGVVANSSSSNAISIVGSGLLTAQSLGTASTTWDNFLNINNGGSIASSTKIVQGIATQCSPNPPAAPVDTTCSADPLSYQGGGGVTYTVGPGSPYGTTQNGNMVCYNALTVGGNGNTVTLNPGIYVINGGALHFESGTIHGGNGVFFYLAGTASLVVDNGANVSLTAPTSGAYSGVLVYQASTDPNPISIQGGSSFSLSGIVYAAGANVSLGNGSGTSVTADIVAQSLTMYGGAVLNSAPTGNLGTLNISGVKLTQ